MLATTPEFKDPYDGEIIPKTVCHSYVTDGKIQFLGDCTHEMAGTTVDLPDVELHESNNSSS